MTGHNFDYQHNGETIRVVVMGDVLALPQHRWSMAGFGRSITADWLLNEANLPGGAPYRRKLAGFLVSALETARLAEREPKAAELVVWWVQGVPEGIGRTAEEAHEDAADDALTVGPAELAELDISHEENLRLISEGKPITLRGEAEALIEFVEDLPIPFGAEARALLGGAT